MYNITVNKRKNRLYLSVGDARVEEMKQFLEKVEQACQQLISGFTCVAEIPKDGANGQKYQDLLFSTEDLILAYGVSKVARVVKRDKLPEVAEKQIWKSRPGIEIVHASDVSEAEQLLDSV